MKKKGTLHFFCGKMAAGKSTKARELATRENAILLSEDEWLRKLYPVEIHVFDDYLRYSGRLKPLIKAHVQDLLNAGVVVVMDFPGNTKNQRMWFKTIFTETHASHLLHYLEASDEQCLRQLEHRSKNLPKGSAFTTEEEFHSINSYFQPPIDEEGFSIKRYA